MVASLIDRAKGSPSSVQEDQEQPRPDSLCTVDRCGRGIWSWMGGFSFSYREDVKGGF